MSAIGEIVVDIFNSKVDSYTMGRFAINQRMATEEYRDPYVDNTIKSIRDMANIWEYLPVGELIASCL